MIKITNICPVCKTEKVIGFDDDFRGDDFPEHEQPWNVTCTVCEGKLIDALNPENDPDGDEKFTTLTEACLLGKKDSIDEVRRIIGIVHIKQVCESAI